MPNPSSNAPSGRPPAQETLTVSSTISQLWPSGSMDPLSAISLAGTILQFIELGSKVMLKISEYQTSTSGLIAGHQEVESVAADLRSLSDKIQRSALEARDSVLAELCATCNKLAWELLAEIQKLEIRGAKRRWDCLCKVVLSCWNKGKIADLQRRMSEVRAQLNLHVVVDLQYASPLIPHHHPFQ